MRCLVWMDVCVCPPPLSHGPVHHTVAVPAAPAGGPAATSPDLLDGRGRRVQAAGCWGGGTIVGAPQKQTQHELRQAEPRAEILLRQGTTDNTIATAPEQTHHWGAAAQVLHMRHSVGDLRCDSSFKSLLSEAEPVLSRSSFVFLSEHHKEGERSEVRLQVCQSGWPLPRWGSTQWGGRPEEGQRRPKQPIKRPWGGNLILSVKSFTTGRLLYRFTAYGGSEFSDWFVFWPTALPTQQLPEELQKWLHEVRPLLHLHHPVAAGFTQPTASQNRAAASTRPHTKGRPAAQRGQRD